jgi:exopolysaccharide production protein ExoQ
MLYRLVLLFSLGCFWWLVRRDNSLRPELSRALWIPTLWVGIISSRPLSMWLGFGGGASTMEGSPVDSLVFFVLIISGLFVLASRRLAWPLVISQNWAVFLFYAFLLVSVLWANSSFVSFKRWVKEFGNIVMVLVILTELNPQQAIRAVFVRCAYLLLPLSLVFIRYFPSLGRYYSSHGGSGEMTGVTTQKNSLGVLILVCGLFLLWDWLKLRTEHVAEKRMRHQTYIVGFLLLLGAYLLYLSDSKTSMICLLIGSLIIASTWLPLIRRRLRMLTVAAVSAMLLFWTVDQIFGVKDDIVAGLGRDMTFTGRTDVWHVLLNIGTDPLIGTGFMSFWDDPKFQSQIPEGSGIGKSAHSGYIEQYLAGGWIGIFFLIIMLLAVGARINRDLGWQEDFGAVRFAIFAVTLIANFSETNFACMTPVGFIFLLASFGYAPGFEPRQDEDPAHVEVLEPDYDPRHDSDFHITSLRCHA